AGKYEVLKIISCLPGPQYKLFTPYNGISDAALAQGNRCNQQNALRVTSYWSRGRWFPATGRTYETLGGMIWSKEPESEIQPKLEYLIDNADGTGCGLREVAQKTVDEVIAVARYGILVDMPASPMNDNGDRVQLTRAQNESGEFAPKWIKYKAEQILTPRTNGKSSSVDEIRLVEIHSKQKDEFEWEDKTFIRRLILIDGIYHNQLWNDKDEKISDVVPVANGENLTEIPFQFFGADDNSAEYSKLPLYDLANENLGHFVLDCDNRDNLHYHGQGMTVVSTDMDKEEFDTMNPNGLDVGARGMNMLDAAGSVSIIQIDATGAIPAEMLRDEDRMVMSGAQVVTDNNANETLGAKRIDANASMSALKRISFNITDGFKQLFTWTAQFLGEESTSMYKLNTDFITDDLTPEMINAHIALVQGNILPAVTLNETARKAGLTDLDNEEIAQELNDQQLLTGGGPEEMAALQAQLDDALEKLAVKDAE
ncbi:MAG TPA: DUF4055 domain-containing protein, partial [Methylococcaceae bacterium]|nr:DUF4055 domain-containing protein [Methylococcaceae bacterium]